MATESTGGTDTSGRQDPLVGRRLASYEVLARVARGGMGVVYRARHVYIDKIVALKVLDPALAQRGDLIERFRTEAQSLARVEHENVVKVIDILEDKGVHFIVMDFAEGTNLRTLVKDKGPMGGDELLSVARQTAEALYAAHREGILHRDIKPENLIMNARGRCKLADFGLAGDLRLISEGHEGPLNFGTPAYTSPEVMRRMVPDKRSDIFGYGATLYFLSTGEPPFGQTGAQAIMLRQKQGAELLEGKRPDLPPSFCKLVMDCIQYHPKDRPASFTEILEALPKRMVTRRVAATGTAPTDATEPSQLDSGTVETVLMRPPSRKMMVALLVMALAAIAIVLAAWLAPLLMRGDTNDLAPNTGSTGQNRPVNRPPENRGNAPSNQPDLTTFKPEDEAFNAAELDCRAALGNADYKAAYGAWARFIEDYPKSGYLIEAQAKQADVAKRVAELRDQEYEKARVASEAALREKQTADAMAALNRFPSELLEALHDSDDLGVASRLAALRTAVSDVEATDLAKLIEKADALRTDWLRDRNVRDPEDSRRRRTAANLLRERDLLDEFLPGRIPDTQARVETRLAELRKEIESAHQESQARVDEWRAFHDETLGAWADRVLKAIEAQSSSLGKRDTKAALKQLDELESELIDLQRKAVQGASLPELAEHIKSSLFVADQLQAWYADVQLADRVMVALENSLRDAKTNGAEREFLVHAEVDVDGNRSARVNKHTGKVVSTGSASCVIDDDGERVTITYSMLTVACLRKLVGGGDSHDAQASLAVWLVAGGYFEEARTELERLEKLPHATAELVSRVRVVVNAQALAPEAVQRLWLIAMRGGARGLELRNVLHDGSLLRRLANAQAAIEAGDAQAKSDYAAALSEVADPELVSLRTLAAASGAGLSDGILNVWTSQLEPMNAATWALLAERVLTKDPVRAKDYALRALVLDGSNEAAWKIVK